MTKLIRVDKYTDDNKVPINPKKATYRYISLFNDFGGIDHVIEYSENGFDLEGESSSKIYYEGDQIPPLIDEEFEEDSDDLS